MAGYERIDDPIARWLEETAPAEIPQRVLTMTFERTRETRQDRTFRRRLPALGRARVVPALASAAAVVVAVALLVNALRTLGPAATPGPSTTPSPSAAGRTFAPGVTGLICGNHAGTWAFPARTPIPGPTIQTALEVLGCSADGGRALIQRDQQNLFVVDADGSETQVTDQLTGITELVGSARPAGAAISPDGSLVIFAGVDKPRSEWRSCHDGALFGVRVQGGQTELLWRTHVTQNGIVRYPTFSPDGSLVAFADGYCDSSHGVWVMRPDGTNAHQIIPTDFGPLGAAHVIGLAWNAAGTRLALGTDQGFFEFAPDGSSWRPITDWSAYCWAARQC